MTMTKEEEKKTALIVIPIIGLGTLAYLLLRGRQPQPPPGKAALYGIVLDAETELGIVGIEVTFNGYLGVSGQGGYYSINDIEPGTYTITFTDPQGRYETAEV